MGIEPMTSSLPRKCSTPELHRQTLSGRRDSNPRPSAWKANALPTELLPLKFHNGGESRIRTYEGVHQQIYSLPQLATLVFPRFCKSVALFLKRCKSIKFPRKHKAFECFFFKKKPTIFEGNDSQIFGKTIFAQILRDSIEGLPFLSQ